MRKNKIYLGAVIAVAMAALFAIPAMATERAEADAIDEIADVSADHGGGGGFPFRECA